MAGAAARTGRFLQAAVPFTSLSRINWKSSISTRLEPAAFHGIAARLSLWFKVAIDQRTFPRGGLRKPENFVAPRRGIRFLSASRRSAFFLVAPRPLEKFLGTRTINPSCTPQSFHRGDSSFSCNGIPGPDDQIGRAHV